MKYFNVLPLFISLLLVLITNTAVAADASVTIHSPDDGAKA